MPTFTDSRQVKKRSALPRLGSAANASVESILDQINTEVDSPLRMSASATPNAVLNFSSSTVNAADSAKEVVSAVKKQVFSSLSNPTINFQTLALSNAADFDIVFPASTVGFFRNVGFTLIGSGKIKALFSPEVATEGALANPGSLFVSGGLPIGYVTLVATAVTPAFKTAGSATDIIENTKIFRFAGGGGASASGSGSGSGGGELTDLLFQAAIRDSFSDIPDGTTTIDIASGRTDATLHDVANELFRLSFDASRTLTGTGTAMTISGAPSFTIKAGDVLVVAGEARRISSITSQTVVTIESAFSVNPSAAACCVSQAVHTVDLNAFDNAGLGLAASSQFTGNIDELLVGYQDSDTLSDIIPDFGTTADVAFSASADNSSWSTARIRPTSLSGEDVAVSTPTSSTQLRLRFFANKSSGTGAVNLLGYKVFFHKQTGESVGAQLLSAFARPTASIAQNCAHGVSGGKSRFTFTWAFPRGTNDGEASGSALVVYANGQRIPRFTTGVTDNTQASFTELSDSVIEMDTDYSSAGIDFQFRVERTVIDSNTQNTTRLSEVESVLEQSVDAQIVPTFLTAVNASPTGSQFRSDITNRKRIPNPAANLNVSMGVQRLMTQSIYQLQDEFGPLGQPVFKASNDKFDMIRFVGDWAVISDGNGVRPLSATASATTNYIEVVFYGTGLNLLCITFSSAQNIVVSIDGGSESANLFAGAAYSGVITGRQYALNNIVPIASGLSLGLHTARIRKNTTSAQMEAYGFEILTERTALQIAPGTAVKGKYENVLGVLSTSAFNSAFESGTLGTRGGNVVAYIKSDGTVGKAVTPTGAQANLTSADHSNEEVLRTYNFREFGANRADDFSTLALSTSSRAFTLDDGTTTLVGSNVQGGVQSNNTVQALILAVANAFVTFTFVGTGLDIIRTDDAAGSHTMTVTVDGVSIGNLATTGVIGVRQEKIVSGLPYGTHTVRITNPAALAYSTGIPYFIVYAPKKPSIPTGAIELAQYYAMANYVANTTSGIDRYATGVLSKLNSREFTYVGAGWTIALGVTARIGGQYITTSTSGNYAEYTFFGTGFEFRGEFVTDGGTQTFSLNGSTNFSTYTTSVFSTGAGVGFTAATGVLDSQTTAGSHIGSGLSVSNLPLGLYTLRITNGTTSVFRIDSLDIITPIHAPASNIPAVFQNTLSVGSDSLVDLRQWNKKDITEQMVAKVAIARGVTSSPTTTSTAMIPMPDMSLTWYSDGEWVEIDLQHDSYNSGANNTVLFQIFINGIAASLQGVWQVSSATVPDSTTAVKWVAFLPKGFHKIDGYWAVTAGTGTTVGIRRQIIAKKLVNN